MREKPASNFSLPLMLSINELAFFGLVILSALAASFYVKQQRYKTAQENKIIASMVDSNSQQVGLSITNITSNLASELVSVSSWHALRNTFQIKTNSDKTLEIVFRAFKNENPSLSVESDVTLLSGQLKKAEAEKLALSNDVQRSGKEIQSLRSGNPMNRLVTVNSTVLGDSYSVEFRFAHIDTPLSKSLSMLAPPVAWSDFVSSKFLAEIDSSILELKFTRPVSEGEMRKELLGLKGSMTNVVFLIDVSGSMDEGERWPQAKQTIGNWIDYLPIQKCALICFSHLVFAFPDGGAEPQLLEIGDTHEGHLNRRRVAEFLRSQRPSGFTDTPRALESAYRITEADTIILFTDGRPTRRYETRMDRVLEQKTYELIQKNQKLRARPINVVGIGNYFDRDFGAYLKKIATLSEGTFIGR